MCKALLHHMQVTKNKFNIHVAIGSVYYSINYCYFSEVLTCKKQTYMFNNKTFSSTQKLHQIARANAGSQQVAKKPMNAIRNRYRDVLPSKLISQTALGKHTCACARADVWY